MDAMTHQIIAFHGGERSRQSTQALGEKIPKGYQVQAMFYTDQYEVYTGVISPAQHRAITKLARKTNHIERFSCTLRQHPAGGLAHKRRVHHEIAQREMGPEAAERQANHIRGQPQCSPT